MAVRKPAVSTPSTIFAQHAERWFDAVSERRSRRTFNEHPVADGDLQEIAALCEKYRPFEDARVALIVKPELDVFRGIVGSYGKVTGAPHVLAIIAREAASPAMALGHAGYLGEAIVLEATARDLSTCWVGGFFKRDLVARITDVAEDERVLAVSPLGHPAATGTFSEEALRSLARSWQRKPFELIAENPELWPAWAHTAVECARLAPSAMNRQPWRFRFENGALVVRPDNKRETPAVAKALDCGIAMLHAELGAQRAGTVGAWEPCDDGCDLARFVPASE